MEITSEFNLEEELERVRLSPLHRLLSSYDSNGTEVDISKENESDVHSAADNK